MGPRRTGAQEVRDEPAEKHELRDLPIGMDEAY